MSAIKQALGPSLRAGCRNIDRALRRRELPVVLCIDIEPDSRAVDPADAGPWRGFETLMERLPDLREGLARATGSAPTFTWTIRMDPQVAETWGSPGWAVESYRDELAKLVEQGDELGLHIHLYRRDHAAGGWVTDHDPGWGTHCLRTGLDAFEAAFQTSCPVHRAGDHSVDGSMLACLAARGVRIDLSVEPGAAPTGAVGEGERARGLTVDFRDVPSEPYRSTPDTFPAPGGGDSGPVLVPLTTTPLRRHDGDNGLVIWMGDRFAVRLLRVLVGRRPSLLAFGLRSSATLDAGVWGMVCKNLEHLAQHRNLRFVTASAAVASLPRLA
jgi:hypothetical protein